jgi:hypothetical protein
MQSSVLLAEPKAMRRKHPCFAKRLLREGNIWLFFIYVKTEVIRWLRPGLGIRAARCAHPCATRAKSHPAFRHRGAAGFLSTYGAM